MIKYSIFVIFLLTRLAPASLFAADDTAKHNDNEGFGFYLRTPDFHQFILFTNSGDVRQSFYFGYGRSAFYSGPEIKCAYEIILDNGLSMSQTDTICGKSLTIAKDHKLFPINQLKEVSMHTTGKFELIIFKIRKFDFLLQNEDEAKAFDSKSIEKLNGKSIEMVPFKEVPK